jgi:hypothetical protein
MRRESHTTRPTTMRPEPSGADDHATHEALAWLSRQLAWERRFAQLRAHTELAPLRLTRAKDPRPDTRVRQ